MVLGLSITLMMGLKGILFNLCKWKSLKILKEDGGRILRLDMGVF